MKILIEVSEKDYLNFMLQYDNGILDEKTPSHRAKIAIANGTPLPKGHGKIVDIKPLMVGLYEGMGKETFSPIEVYKMLDEECRVIIEADEEGSEEG